MADKKISELEELLEVDVASTDLLAIVDVSAGSIGTKKVKVQSLRSIILADVISLPDNTGQTDKVLTVVATSDGYQNEWVTPSGGGGEGGTTLGKQLIGYWPAASIKPRITNACADLAWGETTTNKVNYGYLAFDAGVNEYAHFSFRAPKSLDETEGFTAVLTVSEASGASTHNSAWTIQALALSTTDALDAALSTAVQVNITTASGTQVLSAESSTITPAGTWAAGDMIYVQIGRYATDATNDTLNADAHLIGVTLYATYDAGVEP